MIPLVSSMVEFRLPMLPQPGELVWSVNINGTEVKLNIESNAILLDVLRDQAGSLGTKRGCDMGTCGCCSVLVDGEPRLSCLTLAADMNGREITTVEGLANGHQLLSQNNNPTNEEIKTAIEGNLCRCTGFQQIVDSIRAASDIIRENNDIEDSTSAKSDPHPGFMEGN